MKKLTWILALVLMLAGCSSKETTAEPIQILVPQGAPALALLPLYKGEDISIDSVAGSDPLTAELAKAASDYDVIVAPINLGAKMIEKQSSDYRLASIVTWGNLYIVGSEEYQSGDPLAAFGENAVPQKILTERGFGENVTYFGSAQDVQAQLLSDRFTAGLLAEPAATATIAKAKEKGMSFAILHDLQKNDEGQTGYPQAAIFIKSGREAACEEALMQVEAFLNESRDEAEMKTMMEKVGLENLGIPSAEVALATWERQNLHYVAAEDARDEITAFLKLFDITFDSDMLIR